MASKVTRTCLIALSAVGASGLVAVSAEAAPPTIPTALVNQPAVAGATDITPESATLTGVIDTGGNPGTTFVVPANTTLTWDNSFNLITTSASATEHVDGLPSTGSDMAYPTSSSSEVLNNSGEDNYSTVLFEADPASDYAANGDNPGPETVDANEVNVPTYPGLSAVSAKVGAYPAASSTGLSGPLKPGTKYDYFLVQQAGATTSGVTINTYTPGSATGVNPTYACYPLNYVAATSPYSGYTATGTLSGGVTATGGPAQTTPQPEIQGPCVYYYGGSSNYYESILGTFTTPKLGSVTVTGAAVVIAKTAAKSAAVVSVKDQSVEPAKGTLALVYAGKIVGTTKFTVAAQASKPLALSLTGYGKKLVAKGKRFTSKLVYTTTTDQPTTTKSVTL